MAKVKITARAARLQLIGPHDTSEASHAALDESAASLIQSYIVSADIQLIHSRRTSNPMRKLNLASC